MAVGTQFPEQDLNDIQARLMSLLGDVQLEPVDDRPPAPSAATDSPVRASTASASPKRPEPAEQTDNRGTASCPNCRSQEPWGGASWCPACGYYPALGRVACAPDQEDEEVPAGLLMLIPAWAWWLTAGLAAVFIGSVTARLLLTDVSQRGTFALTQLSLGLLAFAAAHVWAYLGVAQYSDKLTLSSLVFTPGAVWQAAFRRLPGTRFRFYVGGWGVAAGLCAVLIVGINWADLFKPGHSAGKKPSAMKTVMNAAGAMTATQGTSGEPPADARPAAGGTATAAPAKSSASSIEEAVADFAGEAETVGAVQSGTDGNTVRSGTGEAAENSDPVENEPQPTPANDAPHDNDANHPPAASPSNWGKANNDRTPSAPPAADLPTEFVIFGYLANAQGELRSVLVASLDDSNRVRFISRLPLDHVEPRVKEELQVTLDTVRTSRPAWPSPYQARWTAPEVVCRVKHQGLTADGRILEGRLVDFTRQEPEVPSAGSKRREQ